MGRFGSGSEVGKWTYVHKGWKVSVLSIKDGYTQINSPDPSRPGIFFNSEEAAIQYIDSLDNEE